MNANSESACRHILVIDDNQSIHEDFRKILATTTATGTSKLDDFETVLFGQASPDSAQAGYEVDSAFQGKEGLELVRQALQANRPYPMAFVDMRMPPGWDGIETIAKIWQEYPDLQVVICTAYSDYSWDQMLEKLGRTDRVIVLKKPFDRIEVLQLVQTLTEKWERTRQTQHKLSELEQKLQERAVELAATKAALECEVSRRQHAEEELREFRRAGARQA